MKKFRVYKAEQFFNIYIVEGETLSDVWNWEIEHEDIDSSEILEIDEIEEIE